MTTLKNTVEKFSFNNTNTNSQDEILAQLGRELAENQITIDEAIDASITNTFQCAHWRAKNDQNVVDALTTENQCIEWMIEVIKEGEIHAEDVYNETEIIHYTDRAGRARVAFCL